MRTLCSGRCTGRGVGTSGLPTVDLQVVIPERGACRLDLSRALPEILAVDNDGQARRIGENGGGRGTGGEDERAKSQRDQSEPLRRRPVLLQIGRASCRERV